MNSEINIESAAMQPAADAGAAGGGAGPADRSHQGHSSPEGLTWAPTNVSSGPVGAIYARVSTGVQLSGYSIGMQVQECKRYAQERGYSVPEAHIFREDYPGVTLERPELDRLRALARAGDISKIICWDVDRLARKRVYQTLIEQELSRLNVTVEYVNASFDDAAGGSTQKQMRASAAEYEYAKLRERLSYGMRARAQAGYVSVGRIAPYGYRYASDRHKGWLEIVEEEAEVVRTIFRWYVHGDEADRGQAVLGCRSIARRLSELKIPTKHEIEGYTKPKKYAGVWGKSSVDKILKNEVYAGIWHYNKTCRTGRTTVARKPKNEWVAVPVPAIVDREMWEAAQRQSVQNRPRSTCQPKRTYLLQGLLTCAVCGTTFRTYTDRRNTNVEPKGYYQCGGQKLGDGSKDYVTKPCHRSLRQDAWEERVWAQVEAALRDPEAVLETVRARRVRTDQELESVRTWLEALQRNMEWMGEESACLEAIRRDNQSHLPGTMVAAKLAEIAAAQAGFAREAEELHIRLSRSAITDEKEAKIRHFCRMASEGKAFSEEDKRYVLTALEVRGVVQRGSTPSADRLTVTGYFPTIDVPTMDSNLQAALPLCA